MSYGCSKCGHVSCSCQDTHQGPCNPVECDKDVGTDCCVKVVQYLIVSVLQGVPDDKRIIVGPDTVAFSDDLTEDGFVSWVIAKHCEEIKKAKDDLSEYGGGSKFDQSLRVSYCVQARFPLTTVDLELLQTSALIAIAAKK